MKFDGETWKAKWAALQQLNYPSMSLKLAALGMAALLAVLAFSGIQTIAQSELGRRPASDLVSDHLAAESHPPALQLPKQSWAGLSPLPKPPATPAIAPPEATIAPMPLPAPPTPFFHPVPTVQNAPPQEVALADPSNYSDRFGTDIFGKIVKNQPIIVLHETVGSADSAINMFQNHHTNESDQSSYHTVIRRNGTLVYVVPPEKRAFGAGNSVFQGANGPETVRTHRQFPPSVNNFSYHISLETPPDGFNQAETHSGYTDAQYQSLAWLIAQTTVPDDRITTHRAVDQSQSRIDPRSFDGRKLFLLLHTYPMRQAIGSR